jgi:serine/threonine-protein kinase
VKKGRVISQDPEAGERVEEGSIVTLTVSKGVEMGTVPDVVNLKEAEARQAIIDAGFEPDLLPPKFSSEVPHGRIISQSPKAGEELELGSKVSYVPSSGTQTKAVPDVVGQGVDTAQANLAEAGFLVSVTEDYSDTVAPGVIISQNPTAGTKVEVGSTVTIVNSLGKKIVEVRVPSLIGVSPETAQTFLQNSGLTWTIVYKKTNNTGLVVAQNPAAGKTVTEGTQVTITVDADPPQ